MKQEEPENGPAATLQSNTDFITAKSTTTCTSTITNTATSDNDQNAATPTPLILTCSPIITHQPVNDGKITENTIANTVSDDNSMEPRADVDTGTLTPCTPKPSNVSLDAVDKSHPTEVSASIAMAEILKPVHDNDSNEVPEESSDLTQEQAVLVEYIELIDGAMREIYTLLRKDSYTRFIATDRYRKFIKDVIGEHNNQNSTSFV